MTWQIALSLNALFSTIRSGIQKKVVGRVDPQLFLFYVVCYVAIEEFILYLIQFHHLPTLYSEMLLLGILFAVSTSCLFAAIKISLSQTSLFGTYSIVIPMILAVFLLDESRIFNLTTGRGILSIIGIACAVVSLWLISKSDNHHKKRTSSNWLIFILIYILLDGTGQYWNKIFLATHEPFETLISQNVGFLVFIFLSLKIRRIPFMISRNNHVWSFLDSFAEVGFAVFLLLSYKLGPLFLILPIQKIATIAGGMFLGLFLFKEKQSYNREKIIGLCIGIAGILFLVF